MSIFKRFFVVWLTILPFVVWKGTYEGPKVVYFFSGVIFLIIFWVLEVVKEKRSFNFSKADLFYILWLILLLASSLMGSAPFESIIGGSYRHQGFIFFLALWLVGKTVQSFDKYEKFALKKALAWSVLIEGLILFLQYLSGKVYFGHPLGTIGEANSVAGFLAAGSYFVFEFFPKGLGLALGIQIIMEGSRAGVISIATQAIRFGKMFKGPVKKIFIVFLIFSSITALIIMSQEKGNSDVESRQTIWNIGVNQIIKKPFLGYGAETGEAVYDKAFSAVSVSLEGLVIDRTHNVFLDVALWSGITGLFLFTFWLYFSFRNIDGVDKKAALASILVYSFFQPLSIVHWILLMIIVNI